MTPIAIRPAAAGDLPQIHAIINHYVLNTRLTFLQNPASLFLFDAKFREITEVRGLPYLVAFIRRENEGGHLPAGKEAESQDIAQDVVVGYAYLSPFRGHMLSYGPTVELSLFVHPSHQSRGIGSRLLDVVLERTNAPGAVHRAREVVVDDDDGQERTFYAAEGEAGVRIRNILAIMAVDADGKDEGEALRRWYGKRGFVERGRMEKVGFKMGQW